MPCNAGYFEECRLWKRSGRAKLARKRVLSACFALSGGQDLRESGFCPLVSRSLADRTSEKAGFVRLFRSLADRTSEKAGFVCPFSILWRTGLTKKQIKTARKNEAGGQDQMKRKIGPPRSMKRADRMRLNRRTVRPEKRDKRTRSNEKECQSAGKHEAGGQDQMKRKIGPPRTKKRTGRSVRRGM